MIVGSKQFFSWTMLRTFLIAGLLGKGYKELTFYLCNLYPEYCFWLEKLCIVPLVLGLVYLVIIPYAKFCGIKIID